MEFTSTLTSLLKNKELSQSIDKIGSEYIIGLMEKEK
jgi:hypothetical protein